MTTGRSDGNTNARKTHTMIVAAAVITWPVVATPSTTAREGSRRLAASRGGRFQEFDISFTPHFENWRRLQSVGMVWLE